MCGTDVFDDLSLCSITPRAKKRKGLSITESLILIVVVGLTFGAIFTIMSWSTKSYAFSKQDKGSRELLFNWAQTFESLWPGVYGVNVNGAIEEAAKRLDGTYVANGVARIGSFTLTAENAGLSDGVLKLNVTIRAVGSEKKLVDLERSYNAFSNETVSDDTVS
jgi:hypothetical protein